MRWLFKSEPSDYSWDRLRKDGRTEWTGVRNALALRHLRSVRKGDEILFYHTGNEKSVVGVARATRAYDGAVVIAPVRSLARPVPISEIRKDPAFRDFDLVRNSRLSVLPVRDAHWTRVLELGGAKL